MFKRRLYLVVVSVVTLFPRAGHADDLNKILQSIQDRITTHLRALTPGPIPLFGSNYHIGDAWDPTMSHLLFGGDRCFPRLKIRSSPYAIPSFRSNNDASVGFLFRLKKLFEIGASGKQAEIVDINFDDVEEQIVSEYDLKTTLNRTECRDLVSVVSSKPVGDRAPVVIGRLYTGKRRISLNYDDSATATARLSEFLSYTPAVNVTGAVGFGKIVSIADREPVALAFLPAFVPARTAGSVLGEGASNSQSSTFGWAPLDLAKTPSQRSALEELTTQVFQDWLLDAGR